MYPFLAYLAAWFSPRARADARIVASDLPDGGEQVADTATPRDRVILNRAQRQNAASSGIGRRIVHAPASMATANGWEVEEGGVEHVTEDFDAGLNVRPKARDALALARQDGLAWILCVIEGDQNAHEPLTDGPHDVVMLHVLSCYEVVPIAYDADPKSETFGEANVYEVTLQRDGFSISIGRVHRSRLVRFCGLSVDPTQVSPSDGRFGADQSALEAYWPYMAEYEMASGAIAATVKMMSVPVLRMAAHQAAMAAGGTDGRSQQRSYLALLASARRALGAFGLVPLRESDSLEILSPSLTGIGDIMMAQYRRMSTVEGCTPEWLAGERVGGIGANASGQSEQVRAWIGTIQDEALSPALVELYDIRFGRNPTRKIEFCPLDEPTEKEEAETDLLRAQAAAARVGAGITTGTDELMRMDGFDEAQAAATSASLDEPTDAEAQAMAAQLRVVPGGA